MKQSLAAGAKLAHYRILSRLGAGGMGEVYLAQDTRLDRTVALKILPASLSQDPELLERFLREARAGSALKHPNVAPIYEIGESEGLHYLAMEYVEGQTLEARILRRSQDIAEIVDFALQIADALDEAHSKGITHRDIKPANIMITPRGQVKVLDFGLARIDRPLGQASMTQMPTQALSQHGLIMGTVQYMSPEQALGRLVDERTDLFSLGVVLYEMITGRLPFPGVSATETIDRIVHAQPESMARFNYKLPVELERIIRKCLEKDPGRRYQSARDLLIDLKNLKRDISSGARVALKPSPARRLLLIAGALIAMAAIAVIAAYFLFLPDRVIYSVAVLPFGNAAEDPNTEFLSDGITDSLIYSLSRLRKLRVMARSTVFPYKGREVDPRQVGRDLKVDAVLTGRVEQRGSGLLIQADLVNVADGSQLWGDQYRRTLSEALAVQEEIAQQIAGSLRIRLTSEEKAQLARHSTGSAEAYQLYLKGRYYWNKRTEDGFKKAIGYFEQAIERDPNYALAYAGLADCYQLLGATSGALPPKETMAKVRDAAMKALAIDATLAEAHTSLGGLKNVYDWDWAGAEQECKRAIELNPSYATAHQWYGELLVSLGRTEQGLAEVNRAQQLEPVSLIINAVLGQMFYFARLYDRSIEQLRKTLDMDPNFITAHQHLGAVYLQKKMYGDAEVELQKVIDLSGDRRRIALLAQAYAEAGKKDEALRFLNELHDLAKQRHVPPHHFALIYTALGDKNQAFQWLEKAVKERSSAVADLKVEPAYDRLRSDPKFTGLLRKAGLAR